MTSRHCSSTILCERERAYNFQFSNKLLKMGNRMTGWPVQFHVILNFSRPFVWTFLVALPSLLLDLIVPQKRCVRSGAQVEATTHCQQIAESCPIDFGKRIKWEGQLPSRECHYRTRYCHLTDYDRGVYFSHKDRVVRCVTIMLIYQSKRY